MMKLFRCLGEPSSESLLSVALTVAAVAMGLMLSAIIGLTSVILSQRDAIQPIGSMKFGA